MGRIIFSRSLDHQPCLKLTKIVLFGKIKGLVQKGWNFFGNSAFKIRREATSAPSSGSEAGFFGIAAKKHFLETLPCAVLTAGQEVWV